MSSFFTASKPFLTFLRYCGIFPVSFDVDTINETLRTRIYDYFISFIWFNALIFNIYIIISLNFNVYNGNSRILPQAWRVITVMELSLAVGLFIRQVAKRNQLVNFLYKINEYDKDVGGRIENSSSR